MPEFCYSSNHLTKLGSHTFKLMLNLNVDVSLFKTFQSNPNCFTLDVRKGNYRGYISVTNTLHTVKLIPRETKHTSPFQVSAMINTQQTGMLV